MFQFAYPMVSKEGDSTFATALARRPFETDSFGFLCRAAFKNFEQPQHAGRCVES